jgi:multidrug efflux system membrane fusion protein
MDDRPSQLKAPPTRPATTTTRRKSRWHRVLVAALGVAVVVAIGWIAFRPHPQPMRFGRFAGSGALPVVAATAQKGDMPVTLNGLGTVTPLATVTVRTQINGQLMQLGFTEGQEVKKGDFLAEIDPRPYQAALDNAQGQLARDQAQLENAKLDLARYTKLVAERSIAEQQRDTQAALVKQLIGTVAGDQAAVETAKLNLAYCHIVAPVSGRVGLRQVDVGNYVQVSDPNGIVVITQIKPMSVIFTLPEDDLPAVLKRLAAGAKLQVTAFDRSGRTKLATGVLETPDNQIDPTTGALKYRAIFDNTDEMLFPNQFVNVQLLLDTMTGTTVIPNAAVERGSPGTFVYVVKSDNTVGVAKVTLGPSSGEKVAVTAGLQPGDKVVVDGADKLRDGAKVRLVTAKAPAATAEAAPATDPPQQAPGGAPVNKSQQRQQSPP